MTVVPSAVGLVVSDLPRSLSFYRLLGLDIPADADDAPHVEVALTGGFRLMFDPESMHRSVLNIVTNAIDACLERENGRVEPCPGKCLEPLSKLGAEVELVRDEAELENPPIRRALHVLHQLGSHLASQARVPDGVVHQRRRAQRREK